MGHGDAQAELRDGEEDGEEEEDVGCEAGAGGPAGGAGVGEEGEAGAGFLEGVNAGARHDGVIGGERLVVWCPFLLVLGDTSICLKIERRWKVNRTGFILPSISQGLWCRRLVAVQ